jgi:hypothetical protein
MKTMNRREATAAGYHALTSRYELPREQWMLDAVLTDMRRANVNHVVVKDRLGLSVWRSARTAATRMDANVRNVTPHPLPPLPGPGGRPPREEGDYRSRKRTRGGGRKHQAALPRATILNPSRVLKLGRLCRRGGNRR